MQEVLAEIVEKVSSLTSAERRELIELLEKEEKKIEQNGGPKGFVHPNTIWIKKNHARYAGQHVALKDGELIAVGQTIKEVDLKAKEKGVENPQLTYLFPLDREPFGGW